jgi:hypothetical protein
MQTHEMLYFTVTLGSLGFGGLVALAFVTLEKLQERRNVANSPLLGVVYPQYTNKGE